MPVDAVTDLDDLYIIESEGYAYQTSPRCIAYDAGYLAKVAAYEGSDIAKRVNDGRCALLMRHLSPGSSVLDIGAGTGAFIRAARSWGFRDTVGYDTVPEANERLNTEGLYAMPARGYTFDAITMWDVIEHIPEPAGLLGGLVPGTKLFASIPLFADLHRIPESKHYRPNEHLHYWTADGFVGFMGRLGFRLLEQSDHEMVAGRDSIGAFAFVRASTWARNAP